MEQLAFEIDRLLGNKKKQLELAEKAFKFASVEFDNSIAIDQLVLAYRNIIEESATSTSKQN